MTEYGLLLLFVVLVVIAVAKLLGQNTLPLFQVSPYLRPPATESVRGRCVFPTSGMSSRAS
jgi:hypothetical protein